MSMYVGSIGKSKLYSSLGCWSDCFRNCSELSEDMEEYKVYGRHRLDKNKVRLSITLFLKKNIKFMKSINY